MTSLPENLGKRIGPLDDLPPELRAQLQLSGMGDVDQLIVEILRDDLDGVGNLNEILVALYRRTNKVHQRTNISNRLYRMGKAGFVQSVHGKKGVYAVPS